MQVVFKFGQAIILIFMKTRLKKKVVSVKQKQKSFFFFFFLSHITNSNYLTFFFLYNSFLGVIKKVIVLTINIKGIF